MAYKAIVTALRNVRPHPNADRVKLATCHGNQIVIGLDNQEDQLGVYFNCDGQLSPEFCRANNLYRDALLNSDPNGKPGMFDNNRRVRAQRFRGEISDGFWMPLDCLEFAKGGYKTLNEGFEFDEFNGVPICSKYINPATEKIARENQGKKAKRAKTSVMFKEHFDTGHFGKSLHEFGHGQLIIITEKVHGTSSRIGHVLVERELGFWERLAQRIGIKVREHEWKYLNGTRRVVLEESSGTQFHDPTIRDKSFKIFDGNLRKGETAYLEIVGYESTGAPIMPSVDTKGLGDKDFTKRYGEKMHYTYGCEPGQCDFYLYRMTLTNEDGQSVDYSWDDVVARAKEIGVKTVPHFYTGSWGDVELDYRNQHAIPQGTEVDDRDVREHFSKIVESLGSGPSALDVRHIKEGVCVRIEGGLHNKTFKFKSFEFKVLEQIIKDHNIVDPEEAQG